MKKILLLLTLFYGISPALYSQKTTSEDGVVSFALPVRNSLKFNKFISNPTFSFVREQSSVVSFYNKIQWVQFDNAPQTYLFSYAGRFSENQGIAVGLFQQNYGVLTSFGTVVNFAQNVELDQDSNLTFGLNLGFYKSGLNSGKIITNYPDPSLDNIPSNFRFTANPGINYGTAFLDFGISINNLFLYNFKTSKMVQDDPEKSIELHIMHTGYIDTDGFFDKSKFSGLLKTELKKEKTVVSGLMMLSIPNGVWAQAGYNTLYGASAGLGLNITPKISIEYVFEKATGNLSNLGSSHEITLAYTFKNINNYGDEEEEGALFVPDPSPRTIQSKNTTPYVDAKTRAANAQAKLAADAKMKADAAAKIKSEADAKSKADALVQAKLAADAKMKVDAVAKARLEADAKTKAVALAQAKLAADAKMKVDAESKARLEADAKSKADALVQAKLAADAKMKADAAAKTKSEADAKSKADALAQAKLAADAKIKVDADAKARLEADAKTKADALAQAKLAADAKMKVDADAKARLETEAKAKADALAQTKLDEAPKDDNAREMKNLAQFIEDAKKTQQELLKRLDGTVADRVKDLKDLKEENGLSEKGIFKEPKPFKSISAQNNALLSLESEIEQLNKIQNSKIVALESLYKERLKKAPKNDPTAQYYLKTIETLKSDQTKVIQINTNLLASMDKIKVEAEIEKKRRIKRASFENDEGRYLQDVAALKRIKENTKPTVIPLAATDFDFGDEQSNMQIIKNVKNVKIGYYLIIAVHGEPAKRDDFLTKAVAAGQTDVNFFYNVNTSKYYIYYDKYDNLQEATKALESKGSKAYNGKMAIVKIENE